MRIPIASDIHGNLTALKAVLAVELESVYKPLGKTLAVCAFIAHTFGTFRGMPLPTPAA